MTVIAFLVLIGLFLAIAAPGVLALLRPRTAVLATSFYSVLVTALAVYHLGVPGMAEPVIPSPIRSAAIPVADGQSPGSPPAGLCQQALDEARQGGLILRTDRGQVTVNGTIWPQLPESARRALVACLRSTLSGPDAEADVEIVEVNAQQ